MLLGIINANLKDDKSLWSSTDFNAYKIFTKYIFSRNYPPFPDGTSRGTGTAVAMSAAVAGEYGTSCGQRAASNTVVIYCGK